MSGLQQFFYHELDGVLQQMPIVLRFTRFPCFETCCVGLVWICLPFSFRYVQGTQIIRLDTIQMKADGFSSHPGGYKFKSEFYHDQVKMYAQHYQEEYLMWC